MSNFVSQKRHEYKMSTTLQPMLNIIFGNVNFVIVIFNICGLKMQFSESSRKSIIEKSIFGQFEFNFLNVWNLPRAQVANSR